MLGVIIDEQIYLDKFYNKDNPEIYGNIKDLVVILIKHFLINRLPTKTNKQTYNDIKINVANDIIDEIQSIDPTFSRAGWEKWIVTRTNREIRNYQKTKQIPKINKIKSIDITDKELEIIKQIQDKKVEKVAFICLVYSKINNIICNNNSNIVAQSASMILREARVDYRGTKELFMYENLITKGLLLPGVKNTQTFLKVNYCKEGNTILVIEDFTDKNIIYKYLDYAYEHNKKYKKCSECGKRIKINLKNNNKYCTTCAKKIDALKRNKRRNLKNEKMSDF